MLISPERLQRIWGISPKVVLHLGAHEAEELEAYRRLGWGSAGTIWVDALPEKVEAVREKVAGIDGQRVVQAVLWDHGAERIEFKETNDTQASSVLDLKEHAEVYPEIKVVRVREFFTATAEEALPLGEFDRIDLVNIDVQGAELHVLGGFGASLDKVRAIYSEVNVRELYAGGAIFADLDAWLTARGFQLVDSEVLWGVGWGDALWMRREDVPTDAARRRRRRWILEIPRRIKHRVWWILKRRNRG